MKDVLKAKLKKRTITIGSWITLAHPSIAEIMVQSGFDWLVVDMEHSAITLSQAHELIRVISLCGVTPLVRIGENDPTLIKKVMDAGSHGVIVPMVNSREDAEKAVNSVKYPPYGRRGVGLSRAQGYGFDFPGYKRWLQKNSIVIVQIEHIDAIHNLEEILGVPGVDGSIIGPYDLSGSLGKPGEFDHPEVKTAIVEYEKCCKKMKKPMGFHIVYPDIRKTNLYITKGYAFLAVGLDSIYLGQKCRETLNGISKGIR